MSKRIRGTLHLSRKVECPSYKLPLINYVGSEDEIDYGEKCGDVHVILAAPILNRREELAHLGWDVRVLEGLNHVQAMQASQDVPIIRSWLVSAHK